MSDTRRTVRARVCWHTAHYGKRTVRRDAYEILEGPEAGVVFIAADADDVDDPLPAVGTEVLVRYYPDAQHAYRIPRPKTAAELAPAANAVPTSRRVSTPT